MAIDPVCGMRVDPAAPRGGTFEHRGTTYYFCSPGCRTKFAADPDGWLKSGPKGMAPAAQPVQLKIQGLTPRTPHVAPRTRLRQTLATLAASAGQTHQHPALSTSHPHLARRTTHPARCPTRV